MEEQQEAPSLLALPRTVQHYIFRLLELPSLHALACVCTQVGPLLERSCGVAGPSAT
jgi:hypothetical protein